MNIETMSREFRLCRDLVYKNMGQALYRYRLGHQYLIIGYCAGFIQLLPPGIRASTETFQAPGFTLLFQNAPDQVDAHGRAAFAQVLH